MDLDSEFVFPVCCSSAFHCSRESASSRSPAGAATCLVNSSKMRVLFATAEATTAAVVVVVLVVVAAAAAVVAVVAVVFEVMGFLLLPSRRSARWYTPSSTALQSRLSTSTGDIMCLDINSSKQERNMSNLTI